MPASEPLAPLLRLVPGLAGLPRASLGRYPTPLEPLDEGRGWWMKREDRGGELLGGNKVRALEVMLGGLAAGARVATIGPQGSNHALATAWYARALGARVRIVAWRHPMSAGGRRVWERTRRLASAHALPLPLVPAAAMVARLRADRWIPLGGSAPRGILGHVAAGVELAMQVREGVMPEPDRVFLAVGSGGTAAGVSLGLALAGMETEVIGVRAGPRFVSNVRTIRRLARRTHRIIERYGGPAMPALRVRVVHEFYGEGYGVPTSESDRAAADMRGRRGLTLEAAYTAKTYAAMLASSPGGISVFWNTFDDRTIAESPSPLDQLPADLPPPPP